MNKLLSLLVCVFFTHTTYSQAKIWELTTDIFYVKYSEPLQQPLIVSYTVDCPMGDASRSGLDFHKHNDVYTSDNDDYVNNVWDKGHLAPAAAFNCDRETIKKTFSYLNCALQHEGLNRGPWKELERFERNLAKIYDEVSVVITVEFDDVPQRVEGGAAIPNCFVKEITFGERTIRFNFPNVDCSGKDWYSFIEEQN